MATRLHDVDALVLACDYNINNPVQCKQAGVALSIIKQQTDLREDALIDEIYKRAQQYKRRWPTIDITPHALAKHWDLVIRPMPGRATSIRDIARRMKHDEIPVHNQRLG